MLDLRPIKDRLAAATPEKWYREVMRRDHIALVAEVERLRGILEEHRMVDRLQTSEVIE